MYTLQYKQQENPGYVAPEKVADILRHHHWFPHEMMSEKRAQKFDTDYMSLSRSGWYSTSDWLKYHPQLGSGMSSVRNFCVLPKMPFCEKISGSVKKCQQFS